MISKKIFLFAVVVLGAGAWLFFFSGWEKVSSVFAPSAPPAPVHIGIIRYLKIYDPEVDGFKDRMKALGYVEGENVTYDRIDVDAVPDVNTAAKTLIEKNVDLIYAVTTVAANGALKETASANRADIPIVFAQGNAPVEAGIVKSFASSGNNATGIAVNFIETTPKKLQFLMMIDPAIKRVAHFDAVNADPAAKLALAELQKAAPKFGITLVPYRLENKPGPDSVTEIKRVLATIKPGDVDAYYHLPGPLMGLPAQPSIQEALSRLAIPGVWLEVPSVKIVGGLFAYGHDLYSLGEQAADVALKVLNGEQPTNIPIEFPHKYVIAVNLKTAREAKITLPQSILSIADIKID